VFLLHNIVTLALAPSFQADVHALAGVLAGWIQVL